MDQEEALLEHCKTVEAMAEIILDTKTSQKLRDLKLRAVHRVSDIVQKYREQFYDPALVDQIWHKKLAFIMGAKSKGELDEILNPRPPHYNGAGFTSSEYLCPEEELLAWSEASLRAPLTAEGFKRYTELFEQVYGMLIENL